MSLFHVNLVQCLPEVQGCVLVMNDGNQVGSTGMARLDPSPRFHLSGASNMSCPTSEAELPSPEGVPFAVLWVTSSALPQEPDIDGGRYSCRHHPLPVSEVSPGRVARSHPSYGCTQVKTALPSGRHNPCLVCAAVSSELLL